MSRGASACRDEAIEPFLKWAGGKRWLAASDALPIPEQYDRYLEPFLGGGAIFFRLRPSVAVISDLNEELVQLYKIVRDRPDELRAELAHHNALHCKEHYYAVRASKPEDPLGRAVRTLYLNRTCWNGLYRVNLKGEFNVPIGTKDTVLFADENFIKASEALASAEIACRDFEQTIDLAKEGDFVFIDPPYTVQHNFNGFVKYNEKIFSWADQIRLKDSVKRAVSRGAGVVVTNADHETVRDLYRGVCDYRPLSRASVLAGKSDRRGPTTEALFFANLS
ncbi:DNA adenine methylase [Sphingopyxis terrae]|uniref:DNA adenine methylase n=1 Tax=Sphingopyxis terrae TaxID=33052 RepID=UPI002A0EFD46|nr:Dam family site-specific DNA-(adenine-N6)-methyltransferase [Sphingopyxis terrae]MDX8356077.1 Dam family site-specific DNA-(adenine-N6)-methyltransferase [Sphingopyxis terrae]